MFAKLRECKIFKSLSGTLCSIELVEVQNKIPSSSHESYLQSLSMREMGAKSFTDMEKGVEAGKLMSQFKDKNI